MSWCVAHTLMPCDEDSSHTSLLSPSWIRYPGPYHCSKSDVSVHDGPRTWQSMQTTPERGERPNTTETAIPHRPSLAFCPSDVRDQYLGIARRRDGRLPQFGISNGQHGNCPDSTLSRIPFILWRRICAWDKNGVFSRRLHTRLAFSPFLASIFTVLIPC